MSAAAAARMRTVVLVSGNGSNLQAILDAARAGELPVDVAGVISDRPGAYALERARAAGAEAITVDYRAAGSREEFGRRLAAALDRLAPQAVVLAGFMRILPDAVVDRYRGRMLNVHPSLLPLYPGLDTYRRALEAGDPWHGTTVHFVVPELDAGPAIVQYRVRVRPGETEASLRQRVQRGEYLVYPRAIGWLAAGRLAQREGRAWLDGAPLDGPLVVDEAPDA